MKNLFSIVAVYIMCCVVFWEVFQGYAIQQFHKNQELSSSRTRMRLAQTMFFFMSPTIFTLLCLGKAMGVIIGIAINKRNVFWHSSISLFFKWYTNLYMVIYYINDKIKGGIFMRAFQILLGVLLIGISIYMPIYAIFMQASKSTNMIVLSSSALSCVLGLFWILRAHNSKLEEWVEVDESKKILLWVRLGYLFFGLSMLLITISLFLNMVKYSLIMLGEDIYLVKHPIVYIVGLFTIDLFALLFIFGAFSIYVFSILTAINKDDIERWENDYCTNKDTISS